MFKWISIWKFQSWKSSRSPWTLQKDWQKWSKYWYYCCSLQYVDLLRNHFTLKRSQIRINIDFLQSLWVCSSSLALLLCCCYTKWGCITRRNRYIRIFSNFITDLERTKSRRECPHVLLSGNYIFIFRDEFIVSWRYWSSDIKIIR